VERVENIDGLLEEFHRVLKPGGLLVLTTVQAAPEAPCTHTVEAVRIAPAGVPEPRRSLIARLSRLTPGKALSRVGRATPPLRKLARFVKRRLAGTGPSAPPGASALTDGGGPEHLGAVTFAELLRLLGPRFEVVRAHGYGGPIGQLTPSAAED